MCDRLLHGCGGACDVLPNAVRNCREVIYDTAAMGRTPNAVEFSVGLVVRDTQ